MGFKVKHQPMTGRIIPALLAKKIDIIASAMSATAERAQKVDFSIPYNEVTQCWCAGQGNRLPGRLLKSVRSSASTRHGHGQLLEELATSPLQVRGRAYDSTDLSWKT